MKRVFYLMTVSLLFFYGCDNEDFESSDSNINSEFQGVLKSPIGVYNLDKEGNPLEVKTITVEELQAEIRSMGSLKASSNQSINGHFTNQNGTVVTLSAMQNPGGVHGNMIQKGAFGTIKFDALCVWNEGNVGMAGGIILEEMYDVVDGFPFGPGDSIYFVYKDNGEGNNVDLDQYVQGFFYIPLAAWEGTTPFGICEFLPPPTFWDTFFTTPELCGCSEPSGLMNVLNKSDQIQVK